MSKLAEKLKTLGVFNTHDMLRRFADKHRDVACSYYPRQPRTMIGGGTYVFSHSHRTDPQAHPRHYGRKWFAGRGSESLASAVAWATERYGVAEWKTDPTCRWTKVPAEVVARATEAVRSAGSSDSTTSK